jgi:SpoIID/LytB domain protein
MKRFYVWIVILSGFVLAGCGVKPPPVPVPVEEPDIRVGLLWGKSSLEFSVNSRFTLANEDGTFIARNIRGGHWRVEVKSSVPGDTVYVLVAASMSSESRARAMSRSIQEKGFSTFIYPVGKSLRAGNRVIQNNRTYRVCLEKAFSTREEAKTFQESISGRLETFIAPLSLKKPSGILLLTNLDNGQKLESAQSVYILGAPVSLYNVPVGTGYHWERLETRLYPEKIVFQLGTDGLLTAINELPLEEYLRGVVPAEMPAGFPLEALKAQAVAARSEVLARFGKAHPADPFDVCADVHCQSYTGLTKTDPRTDRAVRETRGRVLSKDGAICNAVYSSVCGGHGEHTENVWRGPAFSYLRGHLDGPGSLKRYTPLSREDKVRRWIDDSPAAWCNATSGDFPSALEYTKKYFRWESTFTQKELAGRIADQTGRDLGAILDLIPLERGVSGRIIRLKIKGTEGETEVEGELQIRRALSPTTLWSACFYVIRERIRNGVPDAFRFKGAGWGHGVGMCQTGAAVLALKGARYEQILKFYYHGIKTRSLY